MKNQPSSSSAYELPKLGRDRVLELIALAKAGDPTSAGLCRELLPGNKNPDNFPLQEDEETSILNVLEDDKPIAEKESELPDGVITGSAEDFSRNIHTVVVQQNNDHLHHHGHISA